MNRNRTFLFIDSGGLSVDMARKVGSEGHRVYYYVPYQSAYAKFVNYAPGIGVPEIHKVMDWAPYVDSSDCVVFPDVGMGDLADWMRHKGYIVFGAGKGEEIEQDRIKSIEVMDKIGVKHPGTHSVFGVEEAREKLSELIGQKTETNQNATGKVFVKFNVFRGTMDSFPVGNMEEADYMLNKVRVGFGPYADSLPIIIQETVEGIECGADLIFTGDYFLSPGMIGFEDGGNYVGYITDDMGIYKNDLDRFSKYLRSVNYRGFFSFECMYDGKDCYWIDCTCRSPFPLGLMYPTFIDGFGEFLLSVAMGNAKTCPLPMSEYLACMQLKSENAIDEYLSIKGGPNTKFMHYMMEGDKKFSVPGMSLLGICSARGGTLSECQTQIEAESKQLNIFFLDKDEKFIEAIREKYINPLAELGQGFGPESVASEVPKTITSKKIESRDYFLSEFDIWGLPK